jgi:peroxiredoxin
MSQAEIAGGKLTTADELPSKGKRLPEVELLSSAGETVRISDYRGRRNLVVFLTDQRPETEHLLTALGNSYREIQNQDAQVLVIVPASGRATAKNRDRLKLPFPVLSDPNRLVQRQLGAFDAQNHDAAAVYVTDRFGEVFGVYRIRDQQALPSVEEILDWLEFVNAQCPECEPPEWPI